MATVPACAAVLVVTVLMTSCGQTPSVEPASRSSSSVTASAGSSSATPSAAPTRIEHPQVTRADRRLIRHFVAFAREPSPTRAASIGFAPSGVWLGLGEELITIVPSTGTSDEEAWTIRQAIFRAYTGPFSALELIGSHVARTDPLERQMQVSVGPHPHCASPPVAAPGRVAGLRRVSVQPSAGSFTSCLDWFTVDLFLDSDGHVRAVTLDLYGP